VGGVGRCYGGTVSRFVSLTASPLGVVIKIGPDLGVVVKIGPDHVIRHPSGARRCRCDNAPHLAGRPVSSINPFV
jgi:hypothetical protein